MNRKKTRSKSQRQIEKWLEYYGMSLDDVEPPSGATKIEDLTTEDIYVLGESMAEDRARDSWDL
jgi:hypothetical protein